MVIPLSGWALARFGGRATWLTALSLFGVASVAAGASWNIGSLIAFRVVQGIGGGLLVPVLTTLLVQAAGGKPLGRLMATVSLPAVVVPILGPVIDGLIVSNLSWRWIFYVNVPIAAIGLVLAWRRMPALDRTVQAARPRLDITGIVLLSPAVALILYGLAQVSVDGGFSHRAVFVPIASGCVLLVLFTAWALGRHSRLTPRRRAHHGEHRPDGGRLPGAAARLGSRRQQRGADHAAGRRIVRDRGAHRDPGRPLI
jgi:MFS family permease